MIDFSTYLIAQHLMTEWAEFAQARAAQKILLAPFWGKAAGRPEYIDELPVSQRAQFIDPFLRWVDQNKEPVPVPPLPPTPTPSPAGGRRMWGDKTDMIEVAGKHKLAEQVIYLMHKGWYAFLYGAPGAGKSHLIESMAQDMGLPFLCLALNPDSTKGDLQGLKSPITGDYYASRLRELWEFGGVCLADEVGLALAGLVSMLNGPMAQGKWDFPDGRRVAQHPEFFLLFADNSSLWGDDERFKERQDLGAAFRDRLGYLPFEYDTDLEILVATKIMKGDSRRAARLVGAIAKIRTLLDKEGVPVFASPRFTYRAAECIMDAFLTPEQICTRFLWTGLAADTIAPIKQECINLLGGVR